MQANAARLGEWLTRAAEGIGGALMLAIVIVNLLQVFFRYVLVDPLGWAEEAMRYSVAWMTFLVAGAVLFRGEQLSIDMFGGLLPASVRRVQSIVVLLLIAGICLLLVVQGWPQAVRNIHQLSPSAQIPMVVPYASVVVGGAIMFLKAICLLVAGPERVHGDRGDLGGDGAA